jgi:hypothetical protein
MAGSCSILSGHRPKTIGARVSKKQKSSISNINIVAVIFGRSPRRRIESMPGNVTEIDPVSLREMGVR